MFTDDRVRRIVDAAKSNGIEPAGLLAFVEVEANGSPFEADGRTPKFLYERHVAWREAKKVSDAILSAFKRAGLAIPKWSPKTQYADMRSSTAKLAVLARARGIDEEVANASSSWGIGQSMGFGYSKLGFSSATALVREMEKGFDAQLAILLREIKNRNLAGVINRHDWATAALRYNGEGYRKNNYDGKLATAHRAWSRKVDTIVNRAEAPPEQSLTKEQVQAVQLRLRDLGYTQVGYADGKWGNNTIGAISAFQAHEGLKVDGHYTDETRQALDDATPRFQSAERENVTADDLRGTSRTVDTADSVSTAGAAKIATGGALIAGGGAEQVGLLGQASEVAEKAEQAKTVWDTVHGLLEPIIGNPTTIMIGIALVIGGFLVVRYAKKVIEARVDDERSGYHTGRF